MLGKPKFNYDDYVKFTVDGVEVIGQIYVIDAYGTFEQNEEVSYDIMVENSPHMGGEPCLYKHIRESEVEKSIMKYFTDKEELIKRFDKISNLDKDQIIYIINHAPTIVVYTGDYDVVEKDNYDK